MARVIGKLTARTVQTLAKPGRHSDGGGLYLSISKDGRRRWVFFYKLNGRQREMGLGPVGDVALTRARDLAAECRRDLADGRDPIERRNAERQRDKPVPTFGQVADELLKELESSWKNEKHRYQWRRALEVEAKSLRALPIDKVGVEDVLKALRPIWREKPETAARVRNRIERVLDAGKALNHRSGENPARWRGNLDALLGKRDKSKKKHHRALPIDDTPGFIADLRVQGGMSALALEFTVLTAARTNETLGATWLEIDRAKKLWRVPATRMKAQILHEVPLSARALEILDEAAEGRDLKLYDPIFHGSRPSKPLSNMAMAMVMRRMEVDATPHGFRSTFRDWAGDRTKYPRELSEHALAHQIGDDVERAYRRATALEKRRKLMIDWERFVCSKNAAGNVVSITTAKVAG